MKPYRPPFPPPRRERRRFSFRRAFWGCALLLVLAALGIGFAFLLNAVIAHFSG